MVETVNGFYFPCRKNGELFGLLESYTRLKQSEDIVKVTVTCGVDGYGKAVIPYITNGTYGFVPISSLCESDEDFAKIMKGRRGYYSKFGNFIMIAHGTITMSKNGILNTDRLSFYVPSGIVEDSNGSDHNIVCSRASSVKGLNTCVLSETVLNAYEKTFISSIGINNLFSDKSSFYKARLMGV